MRQSCRELGGSRRRAGELCEGLEARVLLSGTGWSSAKMHPLVHRAAQFGKPAEYTAGSQVQAIAVGDFNRDGKPDLVECENATGMVGVFLNAGKGVFGAVAHYAAGTHTSSVTVGDFNKDHILDLAVAGDDLTILLGTKKGRFGAPTHIAVGNAPQVVVTADFNGDGRPDLAVTDVLGDTVSILFGIGGGQFTASNNIPAGSGPAGIVAADFTGDGKPDLAVADVGEGSTGGGAGVTVLINDGHGTFAASSLIAAGSRPIGIAAGDFNHDGKKDLVVGDGGFTAPDGSNTIAQLFGTGHGTFGAPAFISSQGGTPEGVAVGDINADGIDDVLSANFTGESDIGAFLGGAKHGAGLAALSGVDASTFASPAGDSSLLIADLNGDGKPDIATANADIGTIGVVLHT